MGNRLLSIGANMGTSLLRLGMPLGMDGAIVEINPQTREKSARQYGVPGYETLSEALAAHDDWAGAYIATPNHTHAQFAIDLSRLGIPVFMEKPLGINPAECDQVMKAYARSKGWLQLDFEYRFSPLYQHAAEILHSGEVGELRSINAEYTVGNYAPSYGWRLDPQKAGGMFAEKLCHFIDLFRFWSQSEYADINVSASPKSIAYYDSNSTDNLVALFRMKNGISASLFHTHGSTAVPHREQEETAHWEDCGHRLAVYLNTTEGCIRIDIWKRHITVIRRDPADNMTPKIIRRIDYSALPFMESHHDINGMVRDFVHRVKHGLGPRLLLADSYRTMQAVFECDRQLLSSCRSANSRFSARKSRGTLQHGKAKAGKEKS